jgi:hypothetical protein
VPVTWCVFYSTNFTTNLGSANNVNLAPAVFTGAQQGFYGVNWTISSTTKYPTDCNCSTPGQVVDPNLKQGSEVIPLVAPRLAQLDLTFRRTFRFQEKYSVSAEVSIFNVLNQSVALTESESLGSSAKLYMTGSESSSSFDRQSAAVSAPRFHGARTGGPSSR